MTKENVTRVLVVFGTRPEFIKLFPLIKELKGRKYFEVTVCNTEQQKDLSNQALQFFGETSDISLDIMTANQSLAGLNANLLISLQNVIEKNKYDCIIVQGDTMSVMAASQVAFYNRIPLFHVEAGLRSNNLAHPFPEEMIRKCVGSFANLHFVPTKYARNSLKIENVKLDSIFVTGNTGIDSLLYISNCLDKNLLSLGEIRIKGGESVILVTAHRRENHGVELDNIIEAVKKLSLKYSDKLFIIPVHPNPNVKDRIISGLSGIDNIKILKPLDYPDLVYLMKKASLIITDSGGIQEEAPAFGVPVLVLREHTERNEGIEAGCAKLVGTNVDYIYSESSQILDNNIRNKKVSPYGDGLASKRIVDLIEKYFGYREDSPTEFA